MSWTRLQHAREVLHSSFWLIPALCVAAAIGLGIGLLAVDQDLGTTRAIFLFPGPPQGARSFLSSIIQAMITFTGLVFSITIVVLQLTSGQFSPRVLRTFVSDRTIQLSLGIFLATFVYAMVVLRGIRGASTHEVPRVAVTAAFLLVLLSVAVFIRYVTHIANMIRAASIVDSLGRESRKCLERRFAADHPEIASGDPPLGPARGFVCARRPGVIVSVDGPAIVRCAAAQDIQLIMLPRIGDFVPEGGAILRVHGEGSPDETDLLKHVSFDNERTLEQDLAFGFRQLVDIAQRSLSPAVNDPTTAVQAIDVLHDLLRRLAGRHLTPGRYFDDSGVMRLAVPELSFAGYLGLAVGQIWRYGADSVQVPQRLTEMLVDLAGMARHEYRAEIERWLDIVAAAGERDPTWGTTLDPTPSSPVSQRDPVVDEP